MKTTIPPDSGPFRYAFNASRNCYVAWSWHGSALTRRGCYDPAAVCAEGATASECVGKLPQGARRDMVCGPVRDRPLWETRGNTLLQTP